MYGTRGESYLILFDFEKCGNILCLVNGACTKKINVPINVLFFCSLWSDKTQFCGFVVRCSVQTSPLFVVK